MWGEVKKFEIGDKVKRIDGEYCGMEVDDVDIVINSDRFVLKKHGSGHDRKKFRKVGHMSKHEELTRRIDNVEELTVKEVDDLLQELGGNDCEHDICIPTFNSAGRRPRRMFIDIVDTFRTGKHIVTFGFTDQCSKLEAFKQALHWLLDHSDIKPEPTRVGKDAKMDIDGKTYKVKVLEEC